MWKWILPLLSLASMVDAQTQTYTIRTFAGGGPVVGQAALNYAMSHPTRIAFDSTGNLYVILSFTCQVWVVSPSGILTQVIGNGACGFSGDGGPAAAASLDHPSSVTVDHLGNLYISDISRVRKVSGGIITTVAGTGNPTYNGDNIPATSAALWGPQGLAVDSSNNLYIAEYGNARVRKVSRGIITTVAGTGNWGYNGDNISASSADLNYPEGLAVDSAGNLYIADGNNARIRKVSGGVITTVAGNGTSGYSGDNMSATSAELNFPTGVAIDSSGTLYIADDDNSRVRQVAGGTITTLANVYPGGLALNGGNLYVSDYSHNRVGKLSGGSLTPIAGNGLVNEGDGSAATSAELNQPSNSALDSNGNLYIADNFNCVVRRVDAGTGIISTIAGTGFCFYNGDNISATSAQLQYPSDVAVDGSGNVYIADTNNQRIRKVSGGIITTVAGNGAAGYNSDNISATSAMLNNPTGIKVDASGNLYIADCYNNRIRKVSGGIITTVAGNGTPGYNGDNISATSAELNCPAGYSMGLALDSSGNIYIADVYNNRIRKVSGGIITTVAGNGTSGYSGDNISATSAELYWPHGVAVDSSGNLYIADWNNWRLRKVAAGIITTLAGTGTPGYSGDEGVAVQSRLNIPAGVTVDNSGRIYIADQSNNRIRRLTADACFYILTPSPGASLVAGASSYSVSVTAPAGCQWTASNLNFDWVTITSGASGSGNGTVVYSVQANINSGVRTGYLSIAGINFTLTQAGVGCQVGLTPANGSWGASGTNLGSLSVGFSGQDCQWSASPNVPWVTINSGGSGTGNGTISYAVASNASAIARGGAININVSTTGTEADFNINQAGSTCSYALTQSSQSFSSAGDSGSAAVVASGGCAWTASSNANWLGITSGTTGAGNGTVNYTVQANPSSAARTGTLTIAGQNYVVSQPGISGTLSCAASVPAVPLVALEGRTEVLGDLVLNCTGLTSAIAADILLTLNNTTVTNKLAGTNTSDAMLVNGNTSINGQTLGYTTVHWPGVVLTPSGGNASVRITNVRADATILAVGANLQVPAITGKLSVNSTVAVPVMNPNQTLANAASSLSLQIGPANPLTGGPQTIIPVSYQEATTTAFHAASGNTAATRFRMVITGVPSTVQVYAPVSPAGGAAQGQLYSADCSGSGGSPVTGSPLAGGTYSQLTVNGGVATATWVVLSADPANFDTLTFPLLLLNAGVPDLLQIQIVGSLAPVSPPGIACGGTDPSMAAVPRYRDPAVLPAPVNVRLTTSLTPKATSSAAKVTGGIRLSATSNVGVTFMDTLSNESSSQALTNGTVNGSLQTGNTLLSCAASGGGTCAITAGQYSCSWSSVPPEQSVTCSGDGQVDSSYSPGSTVSNSAGVMGDQTPADTTTVASSSSALVSPSGPTVQIDSPIQSAMVSGTVPVSGWAIEQLAAISNVQIQVDGNSVGTATYGGVRQDVCNIYAGWVGCPNVGFTYSLNTSSLHAGSHVITALVTGEDGLQTAFNVTVTIGTPALPSVAIDSPAPNAILSGTVTVSGWAIDNTTVVGTAISSVQVKVDGAVVGTATYGGARPDVCMAYAGRPGCPNVGYSYSLDTSKLSGGSHTITVSATDSDSNPDSGAASVQVMAPIALSTSRLGVFRGPNSFLEDTIGANAYIPGTTKFIGSFFSSQGVIIAVANGGNGVSTVYQPVQGDVAVAGDWTADGHSKVGIYRPTTGQWFLDINNDGTFDTGDTINNYGGIAGDVPVVGDWLGTGKSCIGIFRSGFLWVLDTNCNGMFDAADAVFPFGGLTNDVPVTGNFGLPGEVGWRVGVVRSYAPGGVVGACNATTTVGCPFYWVIDGANVNAGSAAATHQPAAGSFAFGGVFGDVFVTGDWLGTGISRAGVYRQGNWLEDLTGAHTYDTFFQFGGVATDRPLVGKW